MKYPNLFSPLEIRGHHYRNRILTGPTLFAEFIFNPELGENVLRMVEKRAKGGAAEVTTGELTLGDHNVISMFGVDVDIDRTEGPVFDRFCQYPKRIQKHGAVALLEICHGGGNPNEMTPQQMDDICDVMTRAGRFARKAGFDGTLLHSGHGFLIQQFVSPYFNRRTDEYGGSPENRARFPMRVLQALRKGLGEDGILELRISAEDGVPGGMVVEDVAEFARRIDGMVDIIHISNGQKAKGNRTYTFTDLYDDHGHNIPYAAKVKAAVKTSKVAVIGGINDPKMCEEALAQGKVDFLILARQAFADPEFVNKTAAGREDLIRRCVRCFHCYPGPSEHESEPAWSPVVSQQPPTGAGGPPPWRDRPYWEEENPLTAMVTSILGGGLNVGDCAINPEANLKVYPELFPTPKASRRMLVVGGGVGGMQAAITASQRGHQVTLAERSPQLGGTMNFTDRDRDKVDLRNFKETLKRQLLETDVQVLLNTNVDAAFIEQGSFDHVLIAVGAEEKSAAIPGMALALYPLDVYRHSEEIGQRVIFVGSGLTACETAVHLAGLGKEVTVLCRRDKLAPESTAMQRTALLDEMDRRGVVSLLKTKTLEILPDGVLVEGPDGKQHLPADTVIAATGMTPRRDIVEALTRACAGRHIPYDLIGDCETPGKVRDAVGIGYLRAMLIE